MSLDGGSPIDLHPTEWGGGAWMSDGSIIITRSYAGGLDLLPADGGELQQLTRPDITRGELGHWWPQLLPDEKWVVYTSWFTPIDNARIMALSLESGEQRVLLQGAAFGRWSPTGHLLYVREGKLWAVELDRQSMSVVGNGEPVLDDVHFQGTDGYSNLVLGLDGTLAYVPASVMNAPLDLVAVDRSGVMEDLGFAPGIYSGVTLSPDGRYLSSSALEAQNQDVWLLDLERGTRSRFTFSLGADFSPVWTPDGREVIYCSEEPQFTLYRRLADGSQEPELVLQEDVDTVPTSISPDGNLLVYTYSNVETDSDIWVMALDGSSPPRPLLRTQFSEVMGTVSPDGQWMAYVSNETGREEVYVMAFPDGGSRVQVSIDGGTEPGWSPRGDEIFFRHRSGLLSAAIDPDRSQAGTLVVARPRLLFSGAFAIAWYGNSYAATADAQRFLMVHVPAESMPRTVSVVLNWSNGLQGAGN
jgi:Tol biopolymer transport system component